MKHRNQNVQFFAKILAIIFTLLASGCNTGNDASKNKSNKTFPVKVETLSKSTLVLTIALTGSVEAGRIAQLASPAEGPVLGISVREGDAVTKNQVLLALGRTQGADALVTSFKEDLKKEEDNLKRTRHLVEIGAIAGEQLDIAAASTVRMRAQLIKAQETSRDYAVHAPWAGMVSKMKVRDGDFVSPRAPLVEIYDPDTLIIRLSVPERDAAAIEMGMKAQVELDAYPGKRFVGKVMRVYPYLDNRTRTRTIEISLVQSPKLLPGMFARAFLERETIQEAITVPVHSLVPAPGGGMAIFIIQNEKAALLRVETGIEQDGRIHVLSGLKDGDQLIVSGHEKLKEGATVKPVENGDAKKPGVAGISLKVPDNSAHANSEEQK